MLTRLWSVLLEWFDRAFSILTTNIVLLFICCVLLLVCTCFVFATRYRLESPHRKDWATLVLLYVSLLMLVISSTCISLSYVILLLTVMTVFFLFVTLSDPETNSCSKFPFMCSFNQCVVHVLNPIIDGMLY